MSTGTNEEEYKKKQYNTNYDVAYQATEDEYGLGSVAAVGAAGYGIKKTGEAAIKYGPSAVKSTVSGVKGLGNAAVNGVKTIDKGVGSLIGKGAGTAAIANGTKGLGILGRRVPIITAALEAPAFANGVSKMAKGEKGGARQATKAVTRLSGALGGMWVGFLAGSAVPGPGNVIGAIGGAVAGYYGTKAGDKVVDLVTGENDQEAQLRFDKETRGELADKMSQDFASITADMEAVHALPDGPAKAQELKRLNQHAQQNMSAQLDSLEARRDLGDISSAEFVAAQSQLGEQWEQVDPVIVAANQAKAKEAEEKAAQKQAHEQMMAGRENLYASVQDDLQGKGTKGDGKVSAGEQKVFDQILANNANTVGNNNVKDNLIQGIQTGDIAPDGKGNIIIKGNTEGVDNVTLAQNQFEGIIGDLSIALEGKGGIDHVTQSNERVGEARAV